MSVCKRIFDFVLSRPPYIQKKRFQKWIGILQADANGGYVKQTVLTMTDGKRLKGKYVIGDEDSITLRIGSLDQMFERETIRDIRAESCGAEVGTSGEGVVYKFFQDRQFGFVRSKKTGEQFHFYEKSVKDEGLLKDLQENGSCSQRVKYRVRRLGDGVSKKTSVEIIEWIKNRAALPTGDGDYAVGRRAVSRGDSRTAKTYFLRTISNADDPCRLSAIKDLSELYNREDGPDRAYEFLDSFRDQYPSEQQTFDRMEILYLQRAKRYDEMEEKLKTLLNQKIPENQHKHYARLLHKITNGDEVVLEDSFTSQEEFNPCRGYCDFLIEKCDRHGLEDDVGMDLNDDDEVEKAWRCVIDAQKKSWANIGANRRDQYVNASYSSEQERFLLTRILLARKGSQDATCLRSLWCKFFFRKAQRELFDRGDKSRLPQAFTYLALTGRCIDEESDAFWKEVIPALLLIGVAGTDSVEIERIIKDKEYRTAYLNGGVDKKCIEQLASIASKYGVVQASSEFSTPCVENYLKDMGALTAVPECSYSRRVEDSRLLIRDNTMELDGPELDSAEDFIGELPVVFPEDVQRRSELLVAVDSLRKYRTLVSFVEKRKVFLRLEKIVQDFERICVDKPTPFTIDIYYPLLREMWDRVESDFNETRQCFPKLELHHYRPEEYYYDRKANKIILNVELTSTDETRPSITTISIDSDNHPKGNTPYTYYGVLHGGGGFKFDFSISPTKEEICHSQGVVVFRISYMRDDDSRDEPWNEIVVNLPYTINSSVFVPFGNPYVADGSLAQGRVFVGRTSLLNEMANFFTDNAGGKCYVLYGQRRSGKSSIRANLKDELKKRLGENGCKYSELKCEEWTCSPISFRRDFVNALESSFGIAHAKGDHFADRIRQLSREVRLDNPNRKWIIAIDEFTKPYIRYLQTNDDALKREIEDYLQLIRSLLQEKCFHMIMVGQEVMPLFVETFENEFSVHRKVRLTYLQKEAVWDLLWPFGESMKDREQKISQDAVDALYEITAGNPYFLQKFCSNLIEYLNHFHYGMVGLEQIVAVLKSMCCERDRQQCIAPIDASDLHPFYKLDLPMVKEQDVKGLYKAIADKTYDRRRMFVGDWIPIGDVVGSVDGLSRDDAKEICKVLIDCSFLLHEGDKIRMKSGLLLFWLGNGNML